jgi:protease I
VDIVSIRDGRIRGMNLHEPAGRVNVTKTLEEANAAEYDGLLIPGGFINPDLLRQSAKARAFVQIFDAQQKPIASLCHGPWVMVSAGLLHGRTMTAWPGIRDDVVNAGAVWLDQEVVRDGNLVTSRGPQDLKPFVKAIQELYSLQAPIPRAGTPAASQSSPPRDAPPELVAGAMKWFPKPSFRAALMMGALVTGAALAARRSH